MARAELAVELALALAPGRVELIALRLPDGSTVADALAAARVVDRHGAAAIAALAPGIRGRACTPQTPLREGDRIELTRPLAVDPKQARRLRQQRQRPARRRPRPAGRLRRA